MSNPLRNAAPDDPFANPIWHALRMDHRHLAVARGLALKYPADIAPFACVAENTCEGMRDLCSLIEPNETTYIIGDIPPAVEGLLYRGATPCLQMEFPAASAVPSTEESLPICALDCAASAAMVALTDVAFPGFFRSRTCLMGSYFGIWHPEIPGQLVAMAGERLSLFPTREISGVCTHPDFRGRGLAAALTARLLRHHRQTGARSVLHVVSTNLAATRMYERLGFEILREINLQRIKRAGQEPASCCPIAPR